MGESAILEVQRWASVVRDVGLIIGVPLVVGIGFRLFNAHVGALKAQIDALRAQNGLLGTQADLLRTQVYDRAGPMIEAQKRTLELERLEKEEKIRQLETEGKVKEEELTNVRRALAELERKMSKVDVRAEMISLKARLHEYFHDQLLPEARIRAAKEWGAVAAHDPEGKVAERAAQLARESAIRHGVGDEWDIWWEQRR